MLQAVNAIGFLITGAVLVAWTAYCVYWLALAVRGMWRDLRGKQVRRGFDVTVIKDHDARP